MLAQIRSHFRPKPTPFFHPNLPPLRIGDIRMVQGAFWVRDLEVFVGVAFGWGVDTTLSTFVL